MIFRFLISFVWFKFLSLHTGTYLFKIRTSLELAVTLSPIGFLTERLTQWTVENAVYIAWVLWAIFIDWVVGVWVHVKRRDFSWGKNALGLTLKIGMALFAGSLFEALPYFLKHDNIISQVLLIVTRLAVFLYPAGSAFTNMAEITNGKFPPTGWLKKIRIFNEEFDLKVFEPKKDEPTYDPNAGYNPNENNTDNNNKT